MKHMVLTTDGRKYETDDDPFEDGGFLVVPWNGADHRIPLIAVRDWVTFPDAPGPIRTASPLRGREASSTGGPEPSVPPEAVVAAPEGTTAPVPVRGGTGAGAPPVGQPKGGERELPEGHPALAGGQQMVEVQGVMVPVSDGGLTAADTERVG